METKSNKVQFYDTFTHGFCLFCPYTRSNTPQIQRFFGGFVRQFLVLSIDICLRWFPLLEMLYLNAIFDYEI